MDSRGLHGRSPLPSKTVDLYMTSNKLPAGVQLLRRKFIKMNIPHVVLSTGDSVFGYCNIGV